MRSLRNSPWVLRVASVAVLLLGALCGFTLFFPVENLRPRLEAEGAKHGISVSIGSLTTTFPLGISAKNIVVSSKGLAAGAIKIDHLTVTLAWSRLFLGKVALSYHADLLGGRIEGIAQRRGLLTLQGEGLSWRGALPGLSGGTLAAQGCAGDLSIFWPAQADDAQYLALKCEQGSIEGLLGAKEPLLLGSLTLNGSGKGKDLRLTTLSASGGQLGVDGNGNILLNESLGRSLLNLNLTLRSHAGLNPTLAELLAAFVPPAADGTSRLRLTGTLSAPQQSSPSR